MADSSEYYHVLGIPVGSSRNVIQEAYDTAFQEHNSPYGNKSFEKITEAYDQLMKIENEKDLMSEDEDGSTNGSSSQASQLKKDLILSFEEIFQGGNKRITVQLMDGGKKVKDERITIKIKPGIQPGTELSSSIDLNGSKTEFVLLVQDKPNQRFTRLNSTDIEYVAYITPEQSKSGCELSIPTLENDPISLMFDDEITEDDTEEFSDRGLPSENNKKDRGKLVVRFKISDKPQKQQNSGNKNDNIIEIEVQNKKIEKPKVPEKPKSVLETQNKFDRGNSFNGNSRAANKTTDRVADNSTTNGQNAKIETKKVFTNSSYSISSKILENLNKNANEPEKLPPNNVYLKLTLEEIYRGCVKHQIVTITNTLKNGNKAKEEKQIPVDVKPGSINGTKIIVLNFGDTCVGKRPADVIFTVREEPHSLFKRNGFDIEYIPNVKITQKEAILGGKLSIPTIDNKPFEWTFKGGITPDGVQRIPKRGLPVLNEKSQFGDMLVKCEVMMDQEMPQDPIIRHEISISLDQILSGCTKKVKINRILTDSQGNEKEEAKFLSLEIKPGTTDGTQFNFPREGDQRPGRIPADIVFIVRDKPHEIFTRNGADIEHTMTITKSQLSNGSPLQVPTLANDGPKYISLDGLKENNPFRKIQSCGLPFPDKPEKRGDLLITFNIEEDPQDDPIFRDLELSYEQILFGWVKKLKIKSRIFDINGNEISAKENTIKIVVEKGIVDGTELRFEKLGDVYPGYTPADIIFVVRYKNHPFFERKGYDIYYTAIVTKAEATNGVELEIPTLEGRTLPFNTKQEITMLDAKRFENRGLPFPGDSYKRGDLILKYNIVENKCKDPEIEHPLPLSLEKILEGGEKKLKIKRAILDHEGKIVNEDKVVVINIPPGTKSGDKFSFPRHGDNLNPERIPADIVFVAKEKPHDKFKRNENDIEYTANITEEQARCGCTLEIPTLESVTRSLTIDRYITKSSTRRLKYSGLPDLKYPNKRGDIIVGFKIIESFEKIEESKSNENSKLEQEYNNNDESSSFVPKPNNIIPQDEDVEYYLPVSLENILNGCTKRMRITRKIFDETKNQFEEREKTVPIEIKPGTKNGERITISKAGDKNPNKISADVVFIVEEEKHADFTREGADLLYTAQLTEQQYSAGHKFMIPTLEGGSTPLEISKAYHNINEIKRIPAHGLPVTDNPVVRGDIVVSFQIVENINQELVQKNVTERKTNIQDQQQIICQPLRLETILTGIKDKTTIDKLVTLKDGTLLKQKQMVTINVHPGTEYGTFIYPKDETGKYCSDVVLKITEIKHKYFKRCGADIEYTARITTEKALKGGSIQYHTLEGVKKWFKFKAPINTETIKILPNLGLPCLQDPNRRGNLLIRFEIYENETLLQKALKIPIGVIDKIIG